MNIKNIQKKDMKNKNIIIIPKLLIVIVMKTINAIYLQKMQK